MLEFRILGPLEVVGENGPIQLGGPKQRATLAILLLNVNRVVSVDELADGLYAAAPPVTAVTQVQRQISELRKTLGPDVAIETQAPGYVLRIDAGQLDLARFERLTHEAGRAQTRGDESGSAELLREALALCRGTPLADLVYEPFAQAPAARISELRLAALEQRLAADLALGRHRAIVSELEELVAEHPLHEAFAAQLMLAYYRAGRQADALAVFRRTREALVDELGLAPTPTLRGLEQAILRQEPDLELDAAIADARRRAVLAVATTDLALQQLHALTEPLARLPGRELILVRAVPIGGDVTAAAKAANALRAAGSHPARTAAFATDDLAAEIVRLTPLYDVELVLVDAPPDLAAASIPVQLASLFERSTADVAVVCGVPNGGAGVYVPFGGGRHDWAAAEIGAALAQATGTRLTLVGTRADPARGRRDASRLLADASLAVQQLGAVETVPLLVEPSEEALSAALRDAAVVVTGLAEQWPRSGIGAARQAIIRGARAPVLLVHRGLRPGALAPREGATRFTWSIDESPRYLQAVSFAPT
jgi:DNA-binding SARP family transcriptional activator